jgi:16S rRNA U516 pseudouridylate synthase RsuA-like enzyme
MPYVKAEPDMRKKGDKVKSEWIKVRVSKADFETIHRIAEKAGLSISELIRTRLMKE